MKRRTCTRTAARLGFVEDTPGLASRAAGELPPRVLLRLGGTFNRPGVHRDCSINIKFHWHSVGPIHQHCEHAACHISGQTRWHSARIAELDSADVPLEVYESRLHPNPLVLWVGQLQADQRLPRRPHCQVLNPQAVPIRKAVNSTATGR